MNDKVYNALFVCTHNSARSIIAECLLNTLGAGRWRAWSAGSQPAGAVDPQTLKTLDELLLPTQGWRSKSWDEFSGPDAPRFDFVLTVCDKIAGESCPTWPGQPLTAHWSSPDPLEFQGSQKERARVFRDTAFMLKRRIELMLALPLSSLDKLAIQREFSDIGKLSLGRREPRDD